MMVRPERFERPTLWFVARYSIQLSYGRTVIDCTYYYFIDYFLLLQLPALTNR